MLPLTVLVQQTPLHELHLVVALVQEVDSLVPVLAQLFEESHGADAVVEEGQVAFRVRDIILLNVGLRRGQIVPGLVEHVRHGSLLVIVLVINVGLVEFHEVGDVVFLRELVLLGLSITVSISVSRKMMRSRVDQGSMSRLHELCGSVRLSSSNGMSLVRIVM